MKHLLIVESPAKIKTIKKFLGSDFVIMSTLGHIKDLPKKNLGVSRDDDGIHLDYAPLDQKKEKVIADICKQAQKSDKVYLAPDPDREGEVIAWHIGEAIAEAAKERDAIHRITFNEITKPALENAIASPADIDMDKVAAQQARRVLDRWVGYEVSPILWKKIQRGLSAGRVQSVALRLICDREEEIRTFKPEEYWSIRVSFTHDAGSIATELYHVNKKKPTIKTEKKAQSLAQDISKHAYTIAEIKDTKRAKNPPAPFTTSTLQQAAYNRLGFNVKKTMQIAQKLYEGVPLEDPQTPTALITYMRTDSTRMSDVALKAIRTHIKDAYGAPYVPGKARPYGSQKQKTQDAHEAVRPIDVTKTPEKVREYLDADSYRLYTLIWRRSVACQMTPATYAQRTVLIAGGPYRFKATGSTLLFDGFLKVYDAEEKKDTKNPLPSNIHQEEVVTCQEVTPKQHFTQPPARYTQASLVKVMEKEGIGRPSTYATIMNTIQARDYTTLDEKKRFIPTELGQAVVKLLIEHFPRIMDISFTASMEEDLDKIAHGDKQRDAVLNEFYADFSKALESLAGDTTRRKAEETEMTCPECGNHNLLIRFGKAGAFIGCAGYPDCTFTSNFKREDDGSITLVAKEEPQRLDETCPQCGEQLQYRTGRYGPFTACSGYPKCKYIKQEVANFPCPSCGGELVKRIWKGRVFWGCRSYPTCRFSISGDIIQKPCSSCESPYLLKRTRDGEEVGICPRTTCPSHTTQDE